MAEVEHREEEEDLEQAVGVAAEDQDGTVMVLHSRCVAVAGVVSVKGEDPVGGTYTVGPRLWPYS